ncbi:Fur family transcriptional regulator [Clostridium sp.]|uniref:Fur family transcriptional regulator n=1 Tax=Clostridium sp. TaxID=1506 RepID=UPI0039965EB6
MDNITRIFKEKKLKLTPQRIAVYKYLKNTNEHPSAETIYKALQEEYPTMSLATVYKTLKTLVEVNLVIELNLGEGNFRYDATTSNHSHIQCLHCSKVVDLYGLDVEDLNKKASAISNFEILNSQSYFYGICETCKENM